MSDAFAWARSGPAATLLGFLRVAGDARPVGGCVRDSLLGQPPAQGAGVDIDIATTLLPQRVVEVLGAAGVKTIPTGIAHGTVTAIHAGQAFEITTLRADVATDGRHASVRFDADWATDAARRDFTINAIYLCAEGQLYDPQGGVADLASRKVRFIGRAADRIAEDYLRILRFLRFSARFADDLDEEGWLACVTARDGLTQLSRERIWAELGRIFRTQRAPMAIRAAARDHILTQLCAGPVDPAAFAAVHRACKGQVSPALGFAAIWPNAAEDAFIAGFKPSRAERSAVAGMRAARTAFLAGMAPRAVLYEHDFPAYKDGLILARAGGFSAAAAMEPEGMVMPVLPVRAADFLSRGLSPGIEVGEAMARFQSSWIASGFPEDAAVISQLIDLAMPPPSA